MKMRKEHDELADWTDEDYDSIWYMLYQNSTRGNCLNNQLVMKRYCSIDEREKSKLYPFKGKRMARLAARAIDRETGNPKPMHRRRA